MEMFERVISRSDERLNAVVEKLTAHPRGGYRGGGDQRSTIKIEPKLPWP